MYRQTEDVCTVCRRKCGAVGNLTTSHGELCPRQTFALLELTKIRDATVRILRDSRSLCRPSLTLEGVYTIPMANDAVPYAEDLMIGGGNTQNIIT